MDLETVLQEKDLRVTRPRRLVWDVISADGEHLTAQEVADQVHQRDATVNVSSVYRALALFAELELVRESKLGGDDVSRWETSHGDDVIHLVCDGCGEVMHHDCGLVEDLRDHLATAHRFQTTGIKIAIQGHCQRCKDSI